MRPTAPRITILIVTGLLLVACGGGGSKPTAREPARPLPNQPASRIVTTTEARTITTEATTTTMPEPVRTTVPRTEPRRVADEPAGLFCRDLNAIGYSYSEAVAYWTMHGYPDRMDADLDGIPCETVYARADVIAHWGEAAWNRPLPADLPSGLFCRDLNARGIGYPEAVAYWLAEGAPDRMDADLDGIPCGTVYPNDVVRDHWNGR